MKRTLLVVALVFCVAGKKADRQAAIDAEIAEHPAQAVTVPAPASVEPTPWAVGQWTLYRTADKKGNAGLMKMSVVGDVDCGIWVETKTATAKTTAFSKVCFERFPGFIEDADSAVSNVFELVQVMVTQADSADPVVLDFRTPEGQMMKNMMKSMAQGIVAPMTLDVSAPRKDLTVQAASFAGAMEVNADSRFGPIRVTSQSWAHPAVPLNGTLRTESSTGDVQELIDFRSTGAVSEMPAGR